MKIEIHKYEQYGKNGDRAVTDTRYYDYKVVLVKDEGEEFVVREFAGYDNFMTHVVRDRQDEAQKFANELSCFMGLEHPRVIWFRREEVRQVNWRRQN